MPIIYPIRFQRRQPPPFMIHQIIIIWTIKILLLLCYLLPSLHASKMNPLSQPKSSISTTTTTQSASIVDKDENSLEKGKEEEEEELLQKSKDDTFARDLLWNEANLDITQKSVTTTKRLDYLSWDDYFMSIAFLSSQRSKDPERQRGACIVDAENRIVGIGYNGFPRGCHDDIFPWASSSHQDNILHTKDPFLCDAEVNAILNKCSQDVKNATIYTHDFPGKHIVSKNKTKRPITLYTVLSTIHNTVKFLKIQCHSKFLLFPLLTIFVCLETIGNDSAKIIIQSGINKVVYLYNHDADHSSKKASRIMFEMANIQTRQYKPTCTSFELDFGPIDSKNHNIKSTTTENQSSNILPTTTTTHRDIVFKEAGYDPQTASVRKRVGYLSWDDHFMSVAFLIAKRSKDPSTQV